MWLFHVVFLWQVIFAQNQFTNSDLGLLVLVEHLVEGVVELSGDCVDLQLLPDDLVLELVNPEVELCDVHLSVLGAGVGLLEPDLDLLDLVLVLLLPPPRLLLGHLQLLLVIADGGQLVLDHDDTRLGGLHPLVGSLQLVLNHGEGPGEVVVLHLVVAGYEK